MNGGEHEQRQRCGAWHRVSERAVPQRSQSEPACARVARECRISGRADTKARRRFGERRHCYARRPCCADRNRAGSRSSAVRCSRTRAKSSSAVSPAITWLAFRPRRSSRRSTIGTQRPKWFPIRTCRRRPSRLLTPSNCFGRSRIARSSSGSTRASSSTRGFSRWSCRWRPPANE